MFLCSVLCEPLSVLCSMWALVVKMCRLSATTCQDVSSLGGEALCVCVCVCLYWLCVCVCVCVCVSVCTLFYVSLSCQDVPSFGNNLSRCVVFRKGGFVCVCLSVVCFMWALVVKMCRLSATTCQDVSSLGRGALCVCLCSVLCGP